MKTKNSITEDNSKKPSLPYDDIKVWDIIVARYDDKSWTKYTIWEWYNHAWIISKVDWKNFSIIESVWKVATPPWWPKEYPFNKSSFAWSPAELILLRPKFPNPIREKWKWYIPRIFHKIITEDEARKRVVEYARDQIWEPYSHLSSKWNDEEWYCSKLVFKAYSMIVTWMHIESYHYPLVSFSKKLSSWYAVTPEDLIDSKRTEKYYHFTRND